VSHVTTVNANVADAFAGFQPALERRGRRSARPDLGIAVREAIAKINRGEVGPPPSIKDLNRGVGHALMSLKTQSPSDEVAISREIKALQTGPHSPGAESADALKSGDDLLGRLRQLEAATGTIHYVGHAEGGLKAAQTVHHGAMHALIAQANQAADKGLVLSEGSAEEAAVLVGRIAGSIPAEVSNAGREQISGGDIKQKVRQMISLVPANAEDSLASAADGNLVPDMAQSLQNCFDEGREFGRTKVVARLALRQFLDRPSDDV
jgi:hypothetical protein